MQVHVYTKYFDSMNVHVSVYVRSRTRRVCGSLVYLAQGMSISLNFDFLMLKTVIRDGNEIAHPERLEILGSRCRCSGPRLDLTKFFHVLSNTKLMESPEKPHHSLGLR